VLNGKISLFSNEHPALLGWATRAFQRSLSDVLNLGRERRQVGLTTCRVWHTDGTQCIWTEQNSTMSFCKEERTRKFMPIWVEVR
jgi:hypothetical protein